MALLTRIYFNAVFGALGGLIGWMLFGIFADPTRLNALLLKLTGKSNLAAEDFLSRVSEVIMIGLGGAIIGGAIGYFVVSVEALRDRSLLRFFRLATYGLLLGSVGGLVGILLGEAVNYGLVSLLGRPDSSGNLVRYLLLLLGTMLARGLGWLFLGLAIGASEGLAARSLGKFSYGTIGGALGGGIGGALFGLAYQLAAGVPGLGALFNAIGLVILGACIGSLSALVQGVFQPASVKVMRGWQEGREYPLDKGANSVGRDEHADIALFRDMRVEKRHVVIHRDGKRYILKNNGAPPQFTLVNDRPVAGECELQDGDRIQLGNIVLRFQLRAAVARKGARVAARNASRDRVPTL